MERHIPDSRHVTLSDTASLEELQRAVSALVGVTDSVAVTISGDHNRVKSALATLSERGTVKSALITLRGIERGAGPQ